MFAVGNSRIEITIKIQKKEQIKSPLFYGFAAEKSQGFSGFTALAGYRYCVAKLIILIETVQ